MAGGFLLRTGEGDVYSEEEVGGWLASGNRMAAIGAQTLGRAGEPHPG